MKNAVVVLISVLHASLVSAATLKPNQNALVQRADDVARTQWTRVIQAALPAVDLSKPHAVAWDTQLSDPFPAQWPAKQTGFVFYAFAKGINRVQFKGGEYLGSSWAKITAINATDPSPELVVLTTELKEVSRFRPRLIRPNEISVLAMDPVRLLTSPRSPRGDQQLRDYYCLQRSLNNIPAEAFRAHATFLSWLACPAKK